MCMEIECCVLTCMEIVSTVCLNVHGDCEYCVLTCMEIVSTVSLNVRGDCEYCVLTCMEIVSTEERDLTYGAKHPYFWR
jgi:hypothetical protein